jgi:hypothetical protein
MFVPYYDHGREIGLLLSPVRATGGDFTHGMIHPEQMLGGRTLVEAASHRTPTEALFLCGATLLRPASRFPFVRLICNTTYDILPMSQSIQ